MGAKLGDDLCRLLGFRLAWGMAGPTGKTHLNEERELEQTSQRQRGVTLVSAC